MRRMLLILGSIGLIGLGACHAGRGPIDAERGESTPDDSARARVALDADRSVGEPLRVEALTVWPIYSTNHRDLGEFLTLDEAQEAKVVRISEVGAAEAARAQSGADRDRFNAALRHVLNDNTDNNADNNAVTELRRLLADRATVGELMITNDGRRPILIPGGTVVKGGKQDRQIGEDVVVAPGTVARVRAFCVEQGRWMNFREGRNTQFHFSSANSVAAAPVRYFASYDANQSKVWSNVAHLNAAAAKSPSTGTYFALLEENDPEVRAEQEKLRGAIIEHFDQLKEPAVGFAYAVRDRVVSVRTFAHPRLFAQNFESFLPAICLEARLAARSDDKRSSIQVDVQDVVRLVRDINTGKERVRTTPAGNRVATRLADVGANGRCYVERGPEWVMVTEDWTAKPDQK